METKSERIRPFRPVSPGELLMDELEARGIVADEFAASMGMSVVELDKLFKGKLCIDASLADKLNDHLGIEASFWLRAQATYEDDMEYHDKKKAVKRHFVLGQIKLPWNKVAL